MQSEAVIQWSLSKQQQLQEQLVGFWAQDEWNFNHGPVAESGATNLAVVRFSCTSPNLNTEIKFACWQKIIRKQWSYKQGGSLGGIYGLIGWLNDTASHASSFMEHPLEWWILSLRSYLKKKGLWRENRKLHLDGQQSLRSYRYDDSRISLLRQIYLLIQEAYDDRQEYDKDIWDLRKLNISTNNSLRTRSMHKRDWLTNLIHR